MQDKKSDLRSWYKAAAYYLMPVITLWIAFALFVAGEVGWNFDPRLLVIGPLAVAWISATWVFIEFPGEFLTVVTGHTVWLVLLVFCGIIPVVHAIKRWYRKPAWEGALYLTVAWELLGCIVYLYMFGLL